MGERPRNRNQTSPLHSDILLVYMDRLPRRRGYNPFKSNVNHCSGLYCFLTELAKAPNSHTAFPETSKCLLFTILFLVFAFYLLISLDALDPNRGR